MLVQFPNIKRFNAFYTVLLPFHLVLGTVLSLKFFPNLGAPVKISALISVGIIAYAVSLVNNIFLVVQERAKVMPLYRVAVTWSQILLITIAIPYFSGIFKLPLNAFTQAAFAGFSAFIFCVYFLWTLEFDEEARKIAAGEKVINSLVVTFLVVSSSLVVSFIPTESFLRSLFIASVLMASLGYLQSHYKNTVTKKLLLEYSIITLLFLCLVLIFS